ncbi:MAG: ABC transporter permease [Acidobacteria bacterium]|nr:ABC transporter permease [Acidobacteriota bacterium]
MMYTIIKSILIHLLSFFIVLFLIFLLIYKVGGETVLPTSSNLSLGVKTVTPSSPRIAEMPGAYLRWLSKAIRLEFGSSLSSRRSVSDIIFPRLWNSILLNLFSLALIFIGGVTLGSFLAYHTSDVGHPMESLLYMLYAIPDFVLGVVLLSVFAFYFHWFPSCCLHSFNLHVSGPWHTAIDVFYHLILPGVTLSASGLVFITRFTKSSLGEILDAPFVFALKSRGIPPHKVFRHVLKNGIFPFLTMAGFIIPAIVSGAVVVESLFSYPGIGKTFFDAVLARDYPVILAVTFIDTLFVFMGLMISNFLYRHFDPRVKYADS